MSLNEFIISLKSFIRFILLDIRRSSQAILLKYKYWRTKHRLKKAYGKRKIIVAFAVSEIAKWKYQSLYDYLNQTEAFKPIIFIYPSPLDLNQESSDIDLLLEERINYFKKNQIEVINIWNSIENKCKGN